MADMNSKIAAGKPSHKQQVLFAIWTGTYEPTKQRTEGAADAGEDAKVASLRTTIAALQEAWEQVHPR
jgi:hypothetical protein